MPVLSAGGPGAVLASKRIARCLQMLETFVADAACGGDSDRQGGGGGGNTTKLQKAAAAAALDHDGDDDDDGGDSASDHLAEPVEFAVDVYIVGERIMPEMYDRRVPDRAPNRGMFSSGYPPRGGNTYTRQRLSRSPSTSYTKKPVRVTLGSGASVADLMATIMLYVVVSLSSLFALN